MTITLPSYTINLFYTIKYTDFGSVNEKKKIILNRLKQRRYLLENTEIFS